MAHTLGRWTLGTRTDRHSRHRDQEAARSPFAYELTTPGSAPPTTTVSTPPRYQRAMVPFLAEEPAYTVRPPHVCRLRGTPLRLIERASRETTAPITFGSLRYCGRTANRNTRPTGFPFAETDRTVVAPNTSFAPLTPASGLGTDRGDAPRAEPLTAWGRGGLTGASVGEGEGVGKGVGETDGEGVGEARAGTDSEGDGDGDTDGAPVPEARSASRGTEQATSGRAASTVEPATTARRRPALALLHALTRGHRSR